MTSVRRHTKQRDLEPIAERPAGMLSRRKNITPVPARPPTTAPAPQGDLSAASADEIAAVTDRVWPRGQQRCYDRRRGLRHLLGLLAESPGDTWQQRWLASGLDVGDRPARSLVTHERVAGEITHSLMLLCCLRVIQPSLTAFRNNHFVRYHEHFEAAQNDPVLERYIAAVNQLDTSKHYKRCARLDVAGTLTTQGITFADLTAEALLHYATETRRCQFGRGYELYVGHLAWQVLHESGHFPPSVPATLRGALRAPAMTPAELVDRHDLANREVRDMLVAYLTRRSHDVDYSTLRSLANYLCSAFWREIETIHPNQADLALSEDIYQAWRAAIVVRRDGRPRVGADAILTAVRALYLDLQGWAAHEPEQWARWSAPCPISNRDRKARSKARRRTKERMDNRIRILQPLLSVLVRAVEQQRDHLAGLLSAATDADPDAVFAVGSKLYRRLYSAGDARHTRVHGHANIRVCDEATGQAINVTQAEDTAFWQWAVVETLRHTGARNEEVLELSQLSIRQYARPNGEVVALVVIAPSKTDRERVLPVSAELFHVLACILRRLTRSRPSVALATRYDKHEHVTSEPQPFLFQRTIGQRTEVITPGGLRQMLERLCRTLAVDHPQLATVRFTPHDFRRLFATDLANNGFPIHIGAALLGHLNLQTFHGYVTVFQEDVVRHYQDHLATRRATRPEREYRPVTDTEWDEFEAHFDKRKVELGQCGRPYATPCEHEHACLRCPMLRIDPAMLTRLDDLETDLLARRERAQEEGWLGELEGLDLTLRFLADKRADAQRLVASTRSRLAIPTLRRPS